MPSDWKDGVCLSVDSTPSFVPTDEELSKADVIRLMCIESSHHHTLWSAERPRPHDQPGEDALPWERVHRTLRTKKSAEDGVALTPPKAVNVSKPVRFESSKVKGQGHYIRRDLRDRADSLALDFSLKHQRR